MAIPKIFRSRKMHMCNFLPRLPNVKKLDKKGIFFSVEIKRGGKYVKKFLVF